jgi:putative FmdB family regulatory protein
VILWHQLRNHIPPGVKTMPAYEFRCNVCERKITLTYKTYADYDAAVHTCPHCGSTDLTRLISRVAFRRSTTSRLLSGGLEEDAALSELDNADPATLGRVLREMGSEVGEDLGNEFDEVVDRLERGESPQEIEASLPDIPDTPPASPASED